jgi:hypothetical protein
MAPQIFAQQLAAGAWGMTVANVQQLGVCARFGVRRVLMANQLLGALEVRAVVDLLRQHPDLEFHFLVDSLAQLAAIEVAAATDPPPRKLAALIELGVPGGRTGLRTHDAALALARQVAASRFVALSGLECYEGLQISGDTAKDALTVGALMQRVKELALACDRRSVRRPIGNPHGRRLGRVRHRRARAADHLSDQFAILRNGCRHSIPRLTSACRQRQGAQRRGLEHAGRNRRSRSGRWCSRSPSRGWRS